MEPRKLNDLQQPSRVRTQCVLIVDDDRNLTRFLTTLLEVEGVGVITATDGEAALEAVATETIDLIILDLRMPRMDGRAFFRELRARGHQTPVLIASAFGARLAQHELGAEAAIEKPFDPEVLLDMVTNLLRQ